MVTVTTRLVEDAPGNWKLSATSDDSRLHQIAPYIGKLKPVIARDLLLRFTKANDLVMDCFSGSGTIPLEALLLGRRALAFDSNPYAITLTRAKLGAPESLAGALQALSTRLAASQKRSKCDTGSVPEWVQKFFHPSTLQDILRFADECIQQDDPFLLAALLGILHHQRPGFLSYPSSHLVPYLRDQKYPRSDFPEMYAYRELAPRLRAKLERIFKGSFPYSRSKQSFSAQTDIGRLSLDREVDAIVTSPPYMNALDYVRDNRLRMWFVDRTTADYCREPTDRKEQFDALATAFVDNALARLRPGGRCVLIIGEVVTRKRRRSHPAERMLELIGAADPRLELEQVIHDEIPDVRRARRVGAATKHELVLVLRRPPRRVRRSLVAKGVGIELEKYEGA
jgi:hypothetical protein